MTNCQQPAGDIWSAKEAASFLGVSNETLSRLRVKRQGPPFVRVGGLVRYHRPAVMQWIEEQGAGAVDA